MVKRLILVVMTAIFVFGLAGCAEKSEVSAGDTGEMESCEREPLAK